MILSIYFWKKGKNVIPLLIPMIIIMMITISALIIKFNQSTTILIKSINVEDGINEEGDKKLFLTGERYPII